MTPLNTRARSFLSKKFSLALTGTVAASLIFFPLSGCQTANNSPSNSVASTSGLVTANSFVTVASTDVTPDRMPVEAVHLVGDSVYVYVRGPEGTRVMNLSRGLDVRWARVVGSEDDKVRAPVRIGSRVIFPTSVAIEIFDSRGNIERKQKLPLPITTNVSATSRGMLLAGVASPTGGRVAFIDPTLTILPIVRDALLGDITSRPVEFQDTAYAATVSGKVYAIGENNRAVWPLKDGAFLTDSTISSELVVDDFGLYVAAGDSKLYAIDRISGKIKWRYFAQQHLVATPFVTADRVYQITSDSTLVALDKIEGDPYRKPLWLLSGVRQIVSADDSNIYVVTGSANAPVVQAVDKSTGKVRFSAQRTDFTSFATNITDSTIYAVTKSGDLLAFRPVLTGAAAGALVMLDQ